MNDKVLMALLKRIPNKTASTLNGFKRFQVKNASYPAIFNSSETINCKVNGFVLEEINEKEKLLLDLFEDEYDAIEVAEKITNNNHDNNTKTVTNDSKSDGSTKQEKIFAYVWKKEHFSMLDQEKEWSYDEFVENRLNGFVLNSIAFRNQNEDIFA